MIKKLTILTLIAHLFLIPIMGSGNVEAVVVPMAFGASENLSLGINLYKDGLAKGDLAQELDFGTMRSDIENGPLRGQFYYDVVLHPDTSARKYMITQTASSMSNGTVSLPKGACVVTPWPVDRDGNAYPTGAVSGDQGTFIEDQKLIYQSEPAGTYRPIAMTYAIANAEEFGASEVVPVDHAGGEYNTVITFELVLVD